MPVDRSTREILIAAGRALGRVDLHGLRGLTGVSVTDIEAMALALTMLGLRAIPPETTHPAEPLVGPRLMEF